MTDEQINAMMAESRFDPTDYGAGLTIEVKSRSPSPRRDRGSKGSGGDGGGNIIEVKNCSPSPRRDDGNKGNGSGGDGVVIDVDDMLDKAMHLRTRELRDIHTITNEKGPSSQAESDGIVQETEEERREHDALEKFIHGPIDAKRGLENYCVTVRSMFSLFGKGKDVIEKSVWETLTWLHQHPHATQDEFEAKHKELADKVNYPLNDFRSQDSWQY